MAKKKFVKSFIKKSIKNSSEPGGDAINSMSELIRALSWYNYTDFSDKKKKAWVLDYLGKDNKVKSLKKVNEKYFSHPLSSLCRLAANGYNLTQNDLEWVNSKIHNLMKRGPVKVQENTVKKPSIQDRMRDQASIVIAEVDFFVDEFLKDETVNSLTILLSNNTFGRPQTQHVIAHINNYIKEFETAKDSKKGDRYDYEAYGMSVTKLNRMIKFLSELKKESEDWIMAKKKVSQKPRNIKKKSPEEQCKKVKTIAGTFNKPSRLVGSSYAVIYNEKNKKFTFLVSDDLEGFIVRGTSIINFNAEKSKVFKVKKAYQDKVISLINKGSGINALKKIIADSKKFTELKTTPKGRMNDQCNIIKVL
jgi:hypothetical protein